MFAWVPTLFRQSYASQINEEENRMKDEEELFERFGAEELNVLVVVGRKCTETVSRFLSLFSNLYGGGVQFTNGLMSDTVSSKAFENVQYGTDVLERVLLSQKVSLEAYDVPPCLLVFNKCVGHDDAGYREVIMNNKSLRYTTLTMVSEMTDIDSRLISEMDVLIFFKERNKRKMMSRLRSIWERQFQEHIGFEQFSSCILAAVGVMKASIITAEGLHMIKLGKRVSGFGKMINVCCFPKTERDCK